MTIKIPCKHGSSGFLDIIIKLKVLKL